MTEADWLACDKPNHMLLFATENPDHQGITCCRSVRKLELLAEAWQSRLCGDERWCLGFIPGQANRIANQCLAIELNITTKFKPVAASLLRCIVGNPFRPWSLLYRLFGVGSPADNGPGTLDTCYLTPTVLAGAREAYEARRPDGTLEPALLAMVSDALEEAGVPQRLECRCQGDHQSVCFTCDGSGRLPHPLLAHLRHPGPHVRGCHVVDLLLGKE